jgi:hypothetical protein
MTMLYQCPDCLKVHDEPVDAAFAVVVPCPDCSLDAELRGRARLQARRRLAMPVAA